MDIQHFETLVVSALEDIKGKDIRVIDTTRLTSLFDRVIIATADSNRQTRALAATFKQAPAPAALMLIEPSYDRILDVVPRQLAVQMDAAVAASAAAVAGPGPRSYSWGRAGGCGSAPQPAMKIVPKTAAALMQQARAAIKR